MIFNQVFSKHECISLFFAFLDFLTPFFSPAAIPEFCAVIGEDRAGKLASSANEDEEQAALRSCFSALMTCDPDKIQTELQKLVDRLTAAGGLVDDEFIQ